ncbi:hypothetical protein DL89DRAFT_263624 [Linderina pennispora]|uniref:Uncharacterized protein n=1 Tax=Linderina pennispora TaxID=61395 RepID=A0A1Y1WJ34_9FUNG|nr:uncharacterized protein DL89DRAFT_263624 [Linderina pennispora]ORX73580.1 hypothetical protein DL89DRAFT_263624 [Linderina pennispora]
MAVLERLGIIPLPPLTACLSLTPHISASTDASCSETVPRQSHLSLPMSHKHTHLPTFA